MQTRKDTVESGFSFVLHKNMTRALSMDSLFYPFSLGLHRILVEEEENNYINVSQSDVIRFFLRHHLLSELYEKEVDSIFSKREFQVVKDVDNVINSYKLLAETYQTAAAVINEDGTLVATLSSTDLRNITPNILESMDEMSVKEFLVIQAEHVQEPVVVTENSIFFDIIWKLVNFKVHRVWIVNNEKKPIGVISLTDLFHFLTDYTGYGDRDLDLLSGLTPRVDSNTLEHLRDGAPSSEPVPEVDNQAIV